MKDVNQVSQWQLEGNAPEAYEQYLVPALFASWARQLVERAAIKAGERVLDVACGTGIVARTAAPEAGNDGKVVGVDINEGMLSVARKASSDTGPKIEWQTGDAAELPFPDGRFDVVCCQQALQFFAYPSAALNEMHRVLVSGGRLALNILRPIAYAPAYIVLSDALQKHAGSHAGAMMRSPFPSWNIEQLRDLITDATFRQVHISTVIGSVRFPSAGEFLRREASSSPLAGPIGALSIDARENLLSGLEESIGEYTDDDGVVFPIETYMAIARK